MSIELNKESVEQADASSCQGTNCGTTTGDHSSECLAEAAAGQGWELKPGDLCGRDCPIHKILAEQAGGDERGALQELIRVRDWVKNRRGQPEKLKNTGQTYIMIEKCETLDMLEWAIERARAAMAQPSPVRSSLLINGYQLRAALEFIAPDGTAKQLESEARIEWRQQDADFLEAGLYAWCAEYPEEGCVLLDEEPATAQPSPAQAEQAEAERPIVSFEKYMQVMYDRDENAKRLDAALARIAELEAKLSDPTAVHQWQFSNAWFDGSEEVVLKAGKEGSPIRTLYAAPVAQAQQLHDLDAQCRDDVARALGLRPSQERGFAWSYLLASIKSCVKASEDAAQAQHSVPELDQLYSMLGAESQVDAAKKIAELVGCRLSRSALTEAQMRRLYDNSTEAENERLGFAAFARLMRRAEAVHQIAAAPGKEGA